MSYICCVDSAGSEPLFFERKKAEELVHKLANDFDPTLAPGPDLRSYQVKNRNSPAFHLARNTQMEVWTVRQQSSSRGMLSRVPAKPAVFAIDAREVADNLGKSHHGQTCRIDDRLDSGRLELRSGTAVEPQTG